MKNWKRGAVIVTVLLFVSAAVYLNRAYGKKQEESAAAGAAGKIESETEESAGLFYTSPSQETIQETPDKSGFFAQTRLTRSQARDEATETLSGVSEAEGASAETVAEALAKIMDIAEKTSREAELETMVKAKGFQDCVVFLGDDSATVTVWAETEGLSAADTAQITDIMTTETPLSASQIKIVEIK